MQFSSNIDITEYLINAGAAVASGFFMGLEREFKGKHAGLKTNTLVALGSFVFVFMSTLFMNEKDTDVTRVMGQVIVGIGFLGAGVILHPRNEKKVEGLTTAATIWCSAASGCLAAFGLYLELLAFTLMVVLVNVGFDFLFMRLEKKYDQLRDKDKMPLKKD